MRARWSGDTWLEKVGLAVGEVPTPILETMHLPLLARALTVSVRLGVFEALAGGALDAAALAGRLGTPAGALERLLDTQVGGGMLKLQGGRYALTRLAKKWVLAGSPSSLRDSLLFAHDEWDFIAGLESYVRTGSSAPYLGTLSPEAFERSERAATMRARLVQPELLRQLPSLEGATALLDVGGGHGHHARALLSRWPSLTAEVVDLPQAFAGAASAPRLTFTAGDARTADLGRGRFDVALLSLVAHHFTAAENAALFLRLASALRPGGHLLVLEWIRHDASKGAAQADLLGDLFFSLVSPEAPFTLPALSGWCTAAGLEVRRARRLRLARGMGVVLARKAAP
ncbi:MAG: methyltransferase domain-containing protein [Myxococcaceae bacterium]|nr:methyltransferase domain-containing protein [Myxococcaceae bacterium]